MTNTIIRGRHDHENPYYVASRATAQNVSLSYEALGLLTYLLSKPDNWEVQIDDLIRPDCGRDKVYRIVAELKAAGYMTREKKRNAKGQWEWEPYRLYEQPQSTSPDADAPEPENPDTALPDTGKPEIKALNTETDKVQNDKDEDDDDAGTRENIFALYHATFGKLVSNPMLADDLRDMQTEYAWPDILDAFKAAALANAASHVYARRCLENWRLHGRDKPATPKGSGPLPRGNPSKPNPRVSPLPPLRLDAPPPPWAKAGAS